MGFSSAGMRLLAKEGNQEASVAPPVTFLSASVQLCPHNHRDKVSLPRFAFEFLLSRCRMRNSAADARCPHTYINDVIIHTNTWSAAATNYNLHATPISNCAPSAELTMCRSNVPGTWCKYDIGNYINVSYLHMHVYLDRCAAIVWPRHREHVLTNGSLAGASAPLLVDPASS